MATINDLAVVTLVEIFSYLPLAEQVHIDEVCRRWREQKSYALSQRKQLNIGEDEKKGPKPLFDSPDLVEYFLAAMDDAMLIGDGSALDRQDDLFDRHALYAEQIPPKMLDNIIKLMPNLTVIRIQRKGSFTELWKIKLLLNHYRLQLKEVFIGFKGTFDAAQDNLETSKSGFRDMFLSLITSLNSLEALDVLVLNLAIPEKCRTSIEVDLSVASRLQVMNVSMIGFTTDSIGIDLLAHTYQTYARENETLQQLGSFNWFSLDTLLTFGPRVLAAIREVHVIDWIGTEEYDDFKQLARQCPNLELFRVRISSLSMAQVVKELLPCKALVWLQAYINFDEDHGSVVLEDGLPLDQLPILSSVKFLTIYFTTANHRDLEKMNLEIIFPNVQMVRLHQCFNRCQLCNFTVPADIDQSSPSAQTAYSLQIHECQRLTRLHFAKFSKLTFLIADIGLEMIPSSFKAEVLFTSEELDQKTFPGESAYSVRQE